ncbi:MAG TPA: FAD-binding protein, partial [Candidatus Sutterella merdavium]|nr:FAD-binding protein [Candidatus Sutterella merdavium]
RVTDMRGGTFIIRSPAVVIATGSYAANPDMVRMHAGKESRQYTALNFTTNAPGCTGDGLLLGHMAGAAVRDLELLEFHPTTIATTGDIIPSSVRSNGAILVNQLGKRFVNELDKRRAVVAETEKQPGHVAWLIADEKVVEKESLLRESSYQLAAVTGASEEELARRMRVDPEAFKETLRVYREDRMRGKDAFGRRTMESDLRALPLYAFPVRSAVHGTSGGLVADEHAHVQNEEGKPIPGLYAAGDVMSGLNGLERVSGMGIAAAVVFGREAGYCASRYARPDLPVPESRRLVPSGYSLRLDSRCRLEGSKP